MTLLVSGPSGANSTAKFNYIIATNPGPSAPVAGFTASPTNGTAPLLVNFTDASTGTITNRTWDFGDGSASSATSPGHTYSTAGVYTVSLTVNGPGGSDTATLSSLITATNYISTIPTVNILRPGNGMLYPPVTNGTITIVANATSNEGAGISKIEFFADGAKIGEATSNPGTNVFLNPSLGYHVITADAIDALGGTGISAAVSITIGAQDSPLGTWEVTTSGADKGAQFLTFNDDFSANAFGIRLKTHGVEHVSGIWNFDTKRKVTGPFFGQTGGATNWTGTLLGTAKSLKSITGVVPTTSLGVFHWSGRMAKVPPDLSGTWTGLVTIVKTPGTASYLFTPDPGNSGVFNIATNLDPGTILGQLLLTSHGKAYGYLTLNGRLISLSGNFKAAHPSLTLKGTNQTAEKVSVRLSKQ